LAVAVGLDKISVLPQKLLKEALPGISCVLFKLKRIPVRKMPVLRIFKEVSLSELCSKPETRGLGRYT
jgi:hypothetical protein